MNISSDWAKLLKDTFRLDTIIEIWFEDFSNAFAFEFNITVILIKCNVSNCDYCHVGQDASTNCYQCSRFYSESNGKCYHNTTSEVFAWICVVLMAIAIFLGLFAAIFFKLSHQTAWGGIYQTQFLVLFLTYKIWYPVSITSFLQNFTWTAVDFKFLDSGSLKNVGWWFYDNSPPLDGLD